MRKYLLPGFLFFLDILIVIFSAWFSMIVRFPPNEYAQFLLYAPTFTANLPLWVLCCEASFVLFHLYNRIWQYAGLKEVLNIIAANVAGMLLFLGCVYLLQINLPRSLYFLTLFFASVLIVGSRLLLRQFYKWTDKEDKSGSAKRVLIVGAGDAGHIILQDIVTRDKRKVVGFIDQDPKKIGRLLNGIPVLGGQEYIAQAVAKYGVEEIIIAIPSLPAAKMQELAQLCSECNCPVKVLPHIFASLDHSEPIRMKDLRPLSLEDLLERDPVEMDVAKVGSYLNDKVILVTGAGGSIGSEICRQLLKLKPKKLLLLGRGENSIYEICQELHHVAPLGLLVPLIVNVTDREGLQRVFAKYHPQVVFHAAAHKHVPLMEHQPQEAVRNNVGGSFNLAELAGQYGVERLVLISTDKAVNPSSVMGATKRVTEMIGQAMNKRFPQTRYIAVRFGNVLGSRGSVVPLFKKQIAAGGPVTVTDPEMKRYFMTIPEASQLVIEAGAMGEGGEVFVLDMGKPIKIVDLARDMIRLSGLTVDKDIKIVFTQLRPGEKLFEELMTAEEGTVPTANAKIFKAVLADQDPQTLRPRVDRLRSCLDADRTIALLQELIPTYKPNHF